jgi:asparagine synthase (glutamine-hydrolysing)
VCGIAGRVNVFSGVPVGEAAIEAMTALLAHRGPDRSEVHVRGEVGFGHRRLAIIDLSEGGRQPRITPDGRFWITFNGEIYNYVELRRRLEQRGVRFTSESDTEVLLASFVERGVECLNDLRGMFAFAVWDARDRRLVIARDRVGKKPLFYRSDAHGLAFASESKALLADPGFVPRPNLAAIAHYVSLLYVPGPLSAFDGVHVLPPAHYLVADGEGVRVERYWKLRYEPKRRLSDAEAAEAVLEKLEEAVRLRLISDVPLGAFLSGGIDSGTIVALMAKLGGQQGKVRTFSIGFDEDAFSELDYARQVAARYGTEHHETIVRPDAVEVLPKLVWHYGEPFADSSAIPTFYLSEMTRRHVTVALNGDGGDESFAGYGRYVVGGATRAFMALPAGFRGALARGIGSLIPSGDGAAGRAVRWLAARSGTPDALHLAGRVYFNPDHLAALCTPELIDAVGGAGTAALLARSLPAGEATAAVDRMLSVDVETYLPGDLLAKVDIASMACGLEARSPLLDHELMELVATLPADMKVRGATRKYLLKQVARPLLPGTIVDKPKQGFSVPIETWLRRDLRPMLTDLLSERRVRERGLFRPAAIARLVHEHLTGTRAWHEQLWALLMLELWFERFVDGGADVRGRAAPHPEPASLSLGG